MADQVEEVPVVRKVRLIYDARHMSLAYTGLGRYTCAVLDALITAPKRQDFDLVVLMCHPGRGDGVEPERWARCLEQNGVELKWIDTRPFSAAHYTRMSALVDSLGGDFYFYPHFDLPFGIRTPAIFVVHDLLPLLVDGYVQRFVLLKKAWFRFSVRSSLSRAFKCYAVSETTRRDLLRMAGKQYDRKIAVTYEGPLLNASRSGREASTHSSYLLYVGDRRPHKNLKRLLDIFRVLKHLHGYPGTLHLVGSRKNYGFDVDDYAGRMSGVVIEGPLDDEQLARMYAEADAVVLLSKYEGFGLPVVEAAAMGSRVIVSDGGSLPEIAPPQRCLIPAAMSEAQAAELISGFLAGPCPAIDPEYLAKYNWDNAIRSLFPFAFGDAVHSEPR